MKKLLFTVMTIVCLLALAGCGSSTEDAPAEPLGFNEATNQTITFGGIKFSFPAYYDFKDPRSTEETLHYYPENEDYSGSLFFQAVDTSITPSDFKAAKQQIAEGLFADLGDSTSQVSSEDITMAGLSGIHMAGSVEINNEVGTVHLVLINNIYESKLIMLAQAHNDKDLSNFDYDGDFAKILESATLVKSAASESIVTKPEEPVESSKPSTGEMIGSGDLGDYFVEIKEAALTEDYEGNLAIVVTYSWTNNSDETTSALTSVSVKAFQDGVELESAYILNSSVYDSGASMKDVRPGTTIDVQRAFQLTSESSDIEVEISEWLSFSDEKVIMTFKQPKE